MRSIFFLILLMMAFSGEAYQNNLEFNYLAKRSSAREAKRWTLQEWLETRDRNRMMDLWLAMNSASPFEAMVGASYKSYLYNLNSEEQDKAYRSIEGVVTAQAHMVGLTGEYDNNIEENYNDVTGMLNLRLFGDSIQSTYLSLHYGQRTRTLTKDLPVSAYKNQFGQVSLQLYLMKFFGIDGFHRVYTPTLEESQGQEMRGTLSEAGVFIDFKALRVFGSWYQDVQITRSTLTPFQEVTTLRTGSKAGLKIFF